MSKHTPSPFTIDDRGPEMGADILAVVPNWTEHPSRIAHVAPWPNYLNNANLFAAAPELLEALKGVADCPAEYDSEGRRVLRIYGLAWHAVNAAIAKAEATHD